MEFDYIYMKGHGRGQGTSRNLKVLVKLHMVSADMTKKVKGNFRSLRLFIIQLLLLIHD